MNKLEIYIESPVPISASLLRQVVAAELEAADVPQGVWEAFAALELPYDDYSEFS